MSNEKRWAIVPDYPKYKISTDSEVVNIVTGNPVSVSTHKHGHRVFRVWKNNTTKLLKVYRIKAICFIPNPENKKQVNHLDGNRLNESLENLEWSTPSENMKHAFKNGLCKGFFGLGANHRLRKLSLNDIYEIRALREKGVTLVEIAKKFNVGMSHVCRVAIHKQTIEP